MKTARRIRREAKKLYQLCLIDGLLDEGRTRLVVQKIIEARHRSSMALLSQFQFRVKLDSARHKAEIESAVPVPQDLQASIRSDLARSYGPGMSASFAHNPELIGGMRIKVGSDVYDGSVRAALAALEKSF
jgi:F-type H+-transporting ATPase subunit delta